MKPTDEERREVASEMRQRGYEGYLFVSAPVALELGVDIDDYGEDFDSFSEDAWNRLADLIEPEPERTCRWVSVEESLPESAGEYIVAYHPCYCACVNEAVTLIGMDSFRGKTAWSKRKYQRVTHWMPKPELPKAVEK